MTDDEVFPELSAQAIAWDNRILRFVAYCLLKRAYNDAQGRDLVLGGLTDHDNPNKARHRMAQELQREAELWFLGDDGSGGVSCDDVLAIMRIRRFGGEDFLERAKAGVRWPSFRPW